MNIFENAEIAGGGGESLQPLPSLPHRRVLSRLVPPHRNTNLGFIFPEGEMYRLEKRLGGQPLYEPTVYGQERPGEPQGNDRGEPGGVQDYLLAVFFGGIHTTLGRTPRHDAYLLFYFIIIFVLCPHARTLSTATPTRTV